jgi:hypothetical protein
MKGAGSLLFFAVFLLGFNPKVFSQGKSSLTEKIFETYFEESKPYLLRCAEAEYSGNSNNHQKQESIFARYNALIAQTHVIEKTVKKELDQSSKGKSDKQSIARLLSFHYQKNFRKLPKEYWDVVNKKISNL